MFNYKHTNPNMGRILVCTCVETDNHPLFIRRQGGAGGTDQHGSVGGGDLRGGKSRKVKLHLHELLWESAKSKPKGELFNFRTGWHLLQPHLKNQRVQAALKRGMQAYIAARAAECVRLGINPKPWQISYDHKFGPWAYCFLEGDGSDNTDEALAREYAHRTFYWDDRATALTNEAIQNGQFHWEVKGEEPTDEEWERYDDFARQFYPQPGTYQWYQLQDRGSYWLAGWLEELGKLTFPTLKWRTIIDEQGGHAEGQDENWEVKLIFDILNFEPVDEFGRPVLPNN
jgi:hypothetical protein